MFGVQASTLDLSKIPDYELPAPAPDGRIRTCNEMGYATPYLLGVTKQFVDYAAKCTKPVLDGGASYGYATVAAVKAGATVIMNEMDQKNLDIATKNKELTDKDRERLYLALGILPYDLDLPENSIEAIHMARVLHFFHPKDFEEMFKRAAKWLVPGGRFFLLTASPYHYAASEHLAEYNEKFAKGEKWPGEINKFAFSPGGNEPAKTTGTYLHVVDPKVLMRVASENGFIVKELGLAEGKHDADYTTAVLINNKDNFSLID